MPAPRAAAASSRLPGVGQPHGAEPLAGAAALGNDGRALEVADQARILAGAEDRQAAEQVAGDRLVEQQARLPVLHSAAGIERWKRGARPQRIRRADAEVIIGELVADELGTDARAR